MSRPGIGPTRYSSSSWQTSRKCRWDSSSAVAGPPKRATRAS